MSTYQTVKKALDENNAHVKSCAIHAREIANYISEVCVDSQIDLLKPKQQDLSKLVEILTVLVNEGVLARLALEQHNAVKH